MDWTRLVSNLLKDIEKKLPRDPKLQGYIYASLKYLRFSICACHACAGAMLIFSASFQFYRMIPEGKLYLMCFPQCFDILFVGEQTWTRT